MTLAPNTRRSGLFARDLAVHGDRPAVVTAATQLTYQQLDGQVADVVERLGPRRRLIAVEAGNTVDALVAYLAALRGGHAVLLVPRGQARPGTPVFETYDPDVVIGAASGWAAAERRAGSAHELHPDLALLLSTSGSTGSPKLVRLSRENLQSNAAAISRYLALTTDDRAATTLPMQYCYGLSVVNSHLYTGATLVLTELSVVDRCFWDLFRATGATSFAGVPHTFDLLERAGFESMALPTLRYATQAGGRMHPEKVRRYALLAERDGWELFVMYGQTEATARMAYLPPHLASSHPHTIGVPIPGGTFTIEAPDENGVGELVYRGPNVMLGYAEDPADLALGSTVDALVTGDLARATPDALYEVVGRRSRFVKPYGLRVDLDAAERLLADQSIPAMCTGDDSQLIVGVEHRHAEPATELVARHLELPRSHVSVVALRELPRLPNGKPDYATLRERAADEHCERRTATAGQCVPPADAAYTNAVQAAFCDILGVVPAPTDTFVGLGGDSLTYVEMSIRLEEALGTLPHDWHTTPVGRLTPAQRARRSVARTDTTVVMRAVAILLIVGTHAELFHVPGGAHTLLAVAGYNFARFQVTARATLASIARVAVPSMCWIAVVAGFSDRYGWPNALLINGIIGRPDDGWGYWFIEALVHISVPLAMILALPAVSRFQSRRPFALAIGAVAAGLVVRFDVIDLASSHRTARPHEVFWLFALGWAAARATTRSDRLVVMGLAALAVPGYFGDTGRDLIVLGGLALILWAPTLPTPRLAHAIIGPLAGASLYIYLTHFQVYPPLGRLGGPLSAVVASAVAGIAAWLLALQIIDHARAMVGPGVSRRTASDRCRPQF